MQKQGSDSVKEVIKQAILQNLDAEKLFTTSTTVRIADLGCSIGPNTFFTVENLIESVRSKHRSSSFSSETETLEFQVLFSDHHANDFNTLFASLPPERTYHAAGVLGSFHGRLFPSNSIAVAHSSFALHWLSKQPDLGLGIPNEGRIFYTGAAPHVAAAYSDQFEADLASFLSARADEIVSGGLLLLILPATPDGIPQSELGPSLLFDFLGDSLVDLANQVKLNKNRNNKFKKNQKSYLKLNRTDLVQGAVERRAVDEFNLQMYFPTQGEMRKGVEENGSFRIERMELTNPRAKVEGAIDVASMLKLLRAATEGVLTASFAKSAVEEMFGCMAARTAEISRSMEAAARHPSQLLLVLKRN